MYCILGPRMQYVMDIIMAGLYPVNMDMGVLVICMGHMDCVPKYFMKAGTRTKNTQRMLYFWKTDVSRISNMAFPHKFSTKKIPHRQTISTKSCPPKSSHLYNDELAQFTLSSSSQLWKICFLYWAMQYCQRCTCQGKRTENVKAIAETVESENTKYSWDSFCWKITQFFTEVEKIDNCEVWCSWARLFAAHWILCLHCWLVVDIMRTIMRAAPAPNPGKLATCTMSFCINRWIQMGSQDNAQTILLAGKYSELMATKVNLTFEGTDITSTSCWRKPKVWQVFG